MTESIALQTARTHAINHPHGRADVLLSRLHGVMKSGNGWRARCPACSGKQRDNVSIAVMDGRVLVHCFAGCTRDDVLAAAGLTWKDLQPPRHWPLSPEDRRKERQRMREVGVTQAVTTLTRELVVIRAAAQMLARGHAISDEDMARITDAAACVDAIAEVFVEPKRWRPAA